MNDLIEVFSAIKNVGLIMIDENRKIYLTNPHTSDILKSDDFGSFINDKRISKSIDEFIENSDNNSFVLTWNKVLIKGFFSFIRYHENNYYLICLFELIELCNDVKSNEAFCHYVAHELRNPLGVIMGLLELMISIEMPDAEKKLMLEKAFAHCLRLKDLIASLLA